MRQGAKLVVGVLAVAIVLELAGWVPPVAAQSPPRYRYEQKIMADPSAGPAPLKKRLAVARFDDSTTVEDSPFGVLDPQTLKKHQNDDINSALSKDLAVIRNGFTERLVTALFATDRFVVIERRDLHKILREQDFAKTDRVAKSSALPQGEVLAAQYIVTGVVTLDHGEATDPSSDSEVEMAIPIPGSRFRTTLGSGRATSSDPGATEGQATEGPTMGDRSLLGDAQFECRRANPRMPARYAFHLRVYDVSTSQIVSALRVSADSQWCLIKAGVQRMIAQMDKFPWKSRVVAVEGDRVVVEGGRDVNMDFTSRLVHQPTRRPSEGAAGRSSELSVVEIHDVSSVTRAVRAGANAEIRAGDWVVSMPGGAPR